MLLCLPVAHLPQHLLAGCLCIFLAAECCSGMVVLLNYLMLCGLGFDVKARVLRSSLEGLHEESRSSSWLAIDN